MTNHFAYLTRPGRIGSLELKNRMLVPAMGVNLAESDGSCGERIIAYHERQAKGGVGLIVLGGHRCSLARRRQPTQADRHFT